MFDFKDGKKKTGTKGLQSRFYEDLERVSDLSRLKSHIAKYSNLNPDIDNVDKIDAKHKVRKKM